MRQTLFREDLIDRVTRIRRSLRCAFPHRGLGPPDRSLPVLVCVPRAINLTHPVCAQEADNLIRAEFRSQKGGPSAPQLYSH